MTNANELIEELKQESASTRRVLERIPEAKLAWKPHPKSMTIGQLGLHLAVLPRAIADLVAELNVEAPDVPRPQPSSVAEVVSMLDSSVPYGVDKLKKWGDEGLRENWTLTFKGKQVFAMPRGAVIRSIMLNHSYHHRGMLMVYLRLLDVPLPVVYGATADETMFL